MGKFQDYIIISLLIIIHEIGHFIIASLFGYEVDKIYLYPLGGLSRFNIPTNAPFYKELLILVMGPFFQYICYFLLIMFFPFKLVNYYHYGILLFNLLPIYPLDGGRLVHLLLTRYIPYYKSFIIVISFSYLVTITILFLNTKLSINMIIMYIVLICLIRKEEKNIKIIYHKFLLERLLRPVYFSKIKIINNSNNFYRYYKNVLVCRNGLIGEEEYLRKKYGKFTKDVDIK